MAKRKSTVTNIDSASIDNLTFNQRAGALKNMEVGRVLVGLDLDATTKTTDASTARALPYKGACLAIYNNSSSVAAITLGSDSSITALAPGACAGGNVGVPCTPNDWTFLACYDKQWVKTTASVLLVFLIADDTTVA